MAKEIVKDDDIDLDNIDDELDNDESYDLDGDSDEDIDTDIDDEEMDDAETDDGEDELDDSETDESDETDDEDGESEQSDKDETAAADESATDTKDAEIAELRKQLAARDTELSNVRKQSPRALSVRTIRPVPSSRRGLSHTRPIPRVNSTRHALTLPRATVNPFSIRRTRSNKTSSKARRKVTFSLRKGFARTPPCLKRLSDSSQTKCATLRTRTARRWSMCPTRSFCRATDPTSNRLPKRLSARRELRVRISTTSTPSTGIGLSSFFRAGRRKTTDLCLCRRRRTSNLWVRCSTTA